MTFSGIPIGWALALAAGAAVALVLLHRLRVRPRELRVVTVLFWAHAAERTRARTLFERFRHPLTYALLATICILPCLAAARPAWSGDPKDRLYEVVVVDAGMAMHGAEDRWNAATTAALHEAERLAGHDRLAVIVADPWPRVIQSFTDPKPLLKRKLAGVVPSNRPADRTGAMRLAEALLRGREHGQAVWIGDPDDAVMNASGAPWRGVPVPGPKQNAGIVCMTFEPAAGDPLRGLLRVRVGSWGPAGRDVTLRVDRGGGAPLLDETRSLSPGDVTDFIVPDLPADGDALIARLGPADERPADGTATFRVPLRTPIRVCGGDAVAGSLRAAIAADPSVQWSEDGCTVEVRIGDGPAVIGGTPVSGGDHDFENAVCGSGRGIVPTPETQVLLRAGESALVASVKGAPPQLLISDALWGGGSDVSARPALAVMLVQTLRTLAGWDNDPVTVPSDRAVEDPLWAQGDAVMTMPGSRTASAVGPAMAESPKGEVRRSWWPSLTAALLGMAFVAFLVEAALHARGRIP
ncbi:MAG: VWA domain-containing protein [Phycisphaerae bacterium]|nr:VWA domain-containing protein [Phycisphaerae bacterium]